MYTISYPSGEIRKGGVLITSPSSEYEEYVTWLRAGNGPEALQDAHHTIRVIQVNAWQLRLAINIMGLREAVEASVAASGIMVKDGWNHSPTFSSDHALTKGMGAALGQDGMSMYRLFELAESL